MVHTAVFDGVLDEIPGPTQRHLQTHGPECAHHPNTVRAAAKAKHKEGGNDRCSSGERCTAQPKGGVGYGYTKQTCVVWGQQGKMTRTRRNQREYRRAEQAGRDPVLESVVWVGGWVGGWQGCIGSGGGAPSLCPATVPLTSRTLAPNAPKNFLSIENSLFFFAEHVANDAFSEPPRHVDSKKSHFHCLLNLGPGHLSGPGVSLGGIGGGGGRQWSPFWGRGGGLARGAASTPPPQ